jgi:hypothetical protein
MNKDSTHKERFISRVFGFTRHGKTSEERPAKNDEFMRRAMLVQRNAKYPNETLLRNVVSGYSDALLEKMLFHMDDSENGILLTRAFVLLTENRIDPSLVEGFAESVTPETHALSYELYGNLALYRSLSEENNASMITMETMLASTLKAFANYASSRDFLCPPPLPGLTVDENNLLIAMVENPGRIESITATVIERSDFSSDVIRQTVSTKIPELSKGVL